MTYHLKHAMSLRDHIATRTIGAWIMDSTTVQAGLERRPGLKDSDIDRSLEECAKAVTPEGIEKCIVANIECFISDKPIPPSVDAFLKSIDKQVKQLDQELYEDHRV